MAKTKQEEMKIEEPKAEAPKAEAKQEVVRYDELPADVRKKLEEQALERVAKAAGMSDEEIAEIPAKEEKLFYNIGAIVVHINGQPYTGKGEGPRSMVEQILSLAGNLKYRYQREMTDNGNQKRTQDFHQSISSGVVEE